MCQSRVPASVKKGPAHTDSAPPMTRYRCLRRSQIRAGPEMTSEKRGILHQGAVVNALDTLKLPSGTTRIHFAFGWVSEATGSGLKVMAQLEDEEVVAADDFFHAPPESTATTAHRKQQRMVWCERATQGARATRRPLLEQFWNSDPDPHHHRKAQLLHSV